jgi:hypothetical protein
MRLTGAAGGRGFFASKIGVRNENEDTEEHVSSIEKCVYILSNGS